MTMNSRLSNTVSQQKTPLILYVRGLDDNSVKKQIIINNDSNDDITEELEDEASIPEHVEYYESRENEADIIWSHKKPSDHDNIATEYFLQLRGSEKYRRLFSDKKYGKYRLWSEIAQEMNNAGYYVGEGRDAAEKCRQKFSNLEKTFLNYVKLMRNGNKKRDPPPFYDQMVDLVDLDDKLLKQEQNVTDFVRDALEVELMTKDNILPSSTSKNKDTVNISEMVNKSQENEQNFKRNKQHKEIISLLNKQHSEMMNLQKEFLNKIDNHLKVQNEQRERMINSFIEAMKDTSCNCHCNSKRQRRNSCSNGEQIS